VSPVAESAGPLVVTSAERRRWAWTADIMEYRPGGIIILIGSGLQGFVVTLSEGGLSHRVDALA